MSENFELVLPEPEEIRDMIKEAGLTRTDAANLLHMSRRKLSHWLAPANSTEYRAMPLSAYELLLIKLGKHPQYKKIEN